MEGDLVNKRLIYSLSIAWLCVRLWVVIITPFFFHEDCDGNLPLFLRLVFYTTIISVFAQLVFYTYLIFASRYSKSSSAKMRVFTIQVIFYLLDYIIYGLCRFAIFIAGAVWVREGDTTDRETVV
mmetsp:Transcript_32969/g.57908  ORF Transcript_32969/g.57908 Transcript_32969/m.57908 type:complete len:125 (-) Transcript_32969:16-390(-)